MRRLYRYWSAHPPVHEPLPLAASSVADDPSGIGAMILRFPDGQVKAQ